jgi:hypothetical protein
MKFILNRYQATCVLALSMMFSTINAHTQGVMFSIPAGTDIRVVIASDIRIRKVGQPIKAVLTSPIFVGEQIALQTGTEVEGHIASIGTLQRHVRVRHLLSGDITPPRRASVVIDALLLDNGTRVPLALAVGVGTLGVHNVKFFPKDERPGIKDQLHDALRPFTAPKKLERIGHAMLVALPYHPSYLDKGTVFDAVLRDKLELKAQDRRKSPDSIETALATNRLYLQLTSPIDSGPKGIGTKISAVVTQPLYDAQRNLVCPVGSLLTGTVNTVTPAKWPHKNSALSFQFTTIQYLKGEVQSLHATLESLDVSGEQDLSVDSEGMIRSTTSRLQHATALGSLVQPSIGLADPSLVKTVVDRGSTASSGFGLLGPIMGQASASTAIGFGYYGAAIAIYGAFLARGTDVILPVYTPLAVRLTSLPLGPVLVNTPE